MAYLSRIPSPFRKTALCGLAAVLALAACEDRMAGTSVGTGNPTEIQVSFKDAGGTSVQVTGMVQAYASRQIPVEGYRPAALVEIPVTGSTQATLKADAFKSIPDSMWAKGSVNASGDYEFNLVVTGVDKGGILKGFTYRKAKGEFILRAEDAGAQWNDARTVASIQGSLQGLIELKGTIDTSSLSSYQNYHLFVYGTGISAQVVDGRFILPKVPDGQYQTHLLSLPKKNHLVAGTDSTEVFATTTALAPGSTDLAKGAASDRVRLPDSLILR